MSLLFVLSLALSVRSAAQEVFPALHQALDGNIPGDAVLVD